MLLLPSRSRCHPRVARSSTFPRAPPPPPPSPIIICAARPAVLLSLRRAAVGWTGRRRGLQEGCTGRFPGRGQDGGAAERGRSSSSGRQRQRERQRRGRAHCQRPAGRACGVGRGEEVKGRQAQGAQEEAEAEQAAAQVGGRSGPCSGSPLGVPHPLLCPHIIVAWPQHAAAYSRLLRQPCRQETQQRAESVSAAPKVRADGCGSSLAAPARLLTACAGGGCASTHLLSASERKLLPACSRAARAAGRR